MNCANHPDVEHAAFCQNCGKPLCRECMRTVGSAVYCEPCLEARLAGATAAGYAPGPQTSTGYGQQTSTGYDAATGSAWYSGPRGSSGYDGATGSVWSRVSAPPATGGSGGANPVLAGILGFIPGVGAMYNGQFVKAIVHIVVFAVLNSILVGHDGNAGFGVLFGLMLAGWVFYQVFDAYHTAIARRDGEPLPDPLGLNTLGDRIGIGGARPPAAPYTAPSAGPETATGFPSQAGTSAGPGTSAGFGNGAPPVNPYDPNAWRAAAGVPPSAYAPPASYNAGSYGPVSYGPASYGGGLYGGTATYDPATSPPIPPQRAGHPLPFGAIVLIALGIFFLLGSMDVLNTRWLGGGWPFLLIGLGIWILASRLHGIGGLSGDGSATYRWHLLRALCFPVWAIILTGVLALLDSWRVLSWNVGWAFYLIVWGILVLAMRTASTQMQQESFAAAQAQAAAAATPPAASRTQEEATPVGEAARTQDTSGNHTQDFGGR